MTTTITYEDILQEQKIPAVAIYHNGIFFLVNKSFEKAYGWKKADLVGSVITKIMPQHMRDAHNFGFSRFLATESARILGKPLPLPVYCKDGSTEEAEHFILGKPVEGKWRFAALITPTRKRSL
jgi:PAS domain S-box-containing protein